MHIAVTGAAGFIGSTLCEALLRDGHTLSVIDSFDASLYDPKHKKRNVEGWWQYARYSSERDLLETGPMGFYTHHQPQCLIHLAGVAGVRPSLRDPVWYAQQNVGGTMRVFENAAKYGIPKVIFASSSSVYGTNPSPFDEDMPCEQMVSPYALTKRQGELICDYYAREHGIHAIALRFFTVYGPRQRPDMFIRSAMEKIQAGLPLTIYGDGSSYRDYTYVGDIVEGIKALVTREGSGFEVFNLGGEHPTSMLELLELLGRVLDRPVHTDFVRAQPGDVPGTLANINKARQAFGYAPSVSLEDGLREMAGWLRAQ